MKPLDLTSNFHKMQRRERLLNDTIGDSQQNLDILQENWPVCFFNK